MVKAKEKEKGEDLFGLSEGEEGELIQHSQNFSKYLGSKEH